MDEARKDKTFQNVDVNLKFSKPELQLTIDRMKAKDLGLSITDVADVRLVGAELSEIKALRPKGNYLVEWDLPEGLTMDTYLARKQEKTPLYAEVPEVSFLRTYVREDMVKCLCFYDGESEADVKRARDVVSAPIDRLHRIEGADAN